MLRKNLQDELTAAMKKGDRTRVGTLRFLLAAVTNAGIAKYGSEADAKLTDADVLEVVKKQVKTHNESIEAFEKASRTDLVQKEKEERAILEAYLPQEISNEELKKILEPVALLGGDFGPLMGKAMAAVAGRADGGRVAGLLKQMISSQ